MSETKPMKLLILEDDQVEVNRFASSINVRKEFELIATTNSVFDAIKIVAANEIEGVILDIELNKGYGGSGLDFLIELNKMDHIVRPLVFITTKSESDAVHSIAYKEQVDMIYSKTKPDYSPSIILNQFLTLRPSLVTRKSTSKNISPRRETEVDRTRRIENEINEELNKIGIKPNLKGRKYLFEAIFFLIEHGHKPDAYYTNHLKEKFKLRSNSMSASMQDAINNAWRTTPCEDILENFRANVTYENGTPTPTQFIHYYADAIKIKI